MPQNPAPSTLLVSQIKAGAGIALTPASGTGIVEISQSGAEAPTAITGGASPFPISGQAASSGSNANGGDLNLSGGAKDGTGVNGVVREEGVVFRQQGAPAAATVSATLTAANLLAGIITVLQGAGAASAQQLPLATDLDTALPSSGASDSFDFSVINISTTAAESASITTNTGWTLVGDMDIAANNAATTKSAGRFRARKTAAGAWTLYRLS